MAIFYDFWQKYVSKTSFTFYKILDEHFPFKDNAIVLDFGCGTGIYTRKFKPKNYIGMDVDNKRLRLAKKENPKYTFKLLIPKRGIELKNNSIDQILIMGVMHHLPDPPLRFYVKEFNRILKKGGIIFIIEPTLTKTSPLANMIMRFIDRGKYIRYGEGYINLFKKDYNLIKKASFISESLYNQVIYVLKKKNEDR